MSKAIMLGSHQGNGELITLASSITTYPNAAASIWEDIIGDMSDVIAIIKTTHVDKNVRNVIQWLLAPNNAFVGNQGASNYLWEQRSSNGTTGWNWTSKTNTNSPMEWKANEVYRIVRKGDIMW